MEPMVSIGLSLLVLSVGTVSAVGPPSDEPIFPIDFDVIEIRVRPPEYHQFCDALQLSMEQCAVATAHYDNYSRSLRDLEYAFAEALIRRFDAPDVNEATKLFLAAEGEEGVEALEWVFRRMQQMRPSVISSFETLIDQTTAMLNKDQADSARPAILALRRDVLLNPLVEPGDPDTTEDLRVHVDLELVIRDAEDEEFSALAPGSEGDVATARATIERLRADYREALDRIIGTRAVAALDWRMTTLIALRRRDVDRLESLHRRLQSYRESIYYLNEGTTEAIERALHAAGLRDEATRFRDRVDAAHFPDVWREDRAEKLYHWAMRRDDLTETQRLLLNEVFDAFSLQRRALRHVAQRLTAEFTREGVRATGEFMTHPAFNELIENMSSRETLVALAMRAMNDILTASQFQFEGDLP